MRRQLWHAHELKRPVPAALHMERDGLAVPRQLGPDEVLAGQSDQDLGRHDGVLGRDRNQFEPLPSSR